MFSRFAELECESAGTDPAALTPLDPDLIRWADVIFVMERSHKRRLATKFKAHLTGKRVVVLDIPDEYAFMDPELVRLLLKKVAPLLQLPAGE